MANPTDNTNPDVIMDPETSGCEGKYGGYDSGTLATHRCGCLGYRGHQQPGGQWSRCENQFRSPFTDPPDSLVTCGHARGDHYRMKY
jgi:hypothetical protein